MSILKVAAVIHPSAPSGGLAFSSSGNVTGAGMDLITTQTFSAAASVSVNNCFSSAYDNYRVHVDYNTASADIGINLKLRVGGTDNSAGYYWASNYTTPGAAFLNWSGNTNQSAMFLGYIRDAGTPSHIYEIRSPFLARNTSFHLSCADWDSTALVGTIGWGVHNTATSFDGFSIIPASSTTSGTLRVYGYRN